MQGKRGLIMGLANDRSLAWGIARALGNQGAELAFSYQGEALEKRVRPLAAELGSDLLVDCDVSDMKALDKTFDALKERWGKLDFVVHAIGFSDKNELRGKFVDTSMDNFLMTMNISVYSFVAVAQRARALMSQRRVAADVDLLRRREGHPALQRHGRRQVRARNQRQISRRRPWARRASASTRISAGPIKTLAASGIGDFRYIMKWNEYNSPLRRNVTIEDVGGAGLYLLSDLASGVTGEVHHVDAGYNVVGMKAEDAPDIDRVMADRAPRSRDRASAGRVLSRLGARRAASWESAAGSAIARRRGRSAPRRRGGDVDG